MADLDATCYCGHAFGEHDEDTPSHECCVEGCDCIAFEEDESDG